MWQLICGGVFDRFPGLRVSYETQVHFISTVIAELDFGLDPENDWMGFAEMMGCARVFERRPGEYFGTNVFVGVSPFSPLQVPLDDLVGKGGYQQPLSGFHIGADAAMFGVDYPHFESIFNRCMGEVATSVTTPSVTEADAHKILLTNVATALDFDLDASSRTSTGSGSRSPTSSRADEYKQAMAEIDSPFKNEGNILSDLVKK